MMHTGRSRAFPLASTSITAIARGPVLACDRRAICPCTKAAVAARMTAHPAMRYKLPEGFIAMQVNDKAPAFSLEDQDGRKVVLKDFTGKTVILFFFPKADTPG
jgi:hypothetical protein